METNSKEYMRKHRTRKVDEAALMIKIEDLQKRIEESRRLKEEYNNG